MIFIFIPIVLFAAGCGSTAIAANRIHSAQSRYENRRRRYEEVPRKYRRTEKKLNKMVGQLVEARFDAQRTLGEVARFLKNANVRDRKFASGLPIGARKLQKWEDCAIRIEEIIAAGGISAVVGATTAMAVYGTAATFGVASTGTAIGTLSGAVATKATLACLGGGSLAAGGAGITGGIIATGGFVAGPAVLIASFFLHGKACEIEHQVHHAILELDRHEKKLLAREAILAGANKRARELLDITASLNERLQQQLRGAKTGDPKACQTLIKSARHLGRILDDKIFP